VTFGSFEVSERPLQLLQSFESTADARVNGWMESKVAAVDVELCQLNLLFTIEELSHHVAMLLFVPAMSNDGLEWSQFFPPNCENRFTALELPRSCPIRRTFRAVWKSLRVPVRATDG
jgi:hypothetical protein